MNKVITVNPYSMASYYVDMFFDDIKLSNATCFFTKRKDKIYLVTNWHVVSGRNADTKKCLNEMGSVPSVSSLWNSLRSIGIRSSLKV